MSLIFQIALQLLQNIVASLIHYGWLECEILLVHVEVVIENFKFVGVFHQYKRNALGLQNLQINIGRLILLVHLFLFKN